MKKLLAVAAIAFGMSGAANAALITFDFTGGKGANAFYEFTADGVTATATASYNGFDNAADVKHDYHRRTKTSHGIGVKNGVLDSGKIDGRGRNDFLTLTFDYVVELIGFTFEHDTKNDEFDLYVDQSKVRNNLETTDGLDAFAPDTFEGSTFSIRANQRNDNFVLSSMLINTIAVPEPSTIALFGLGLAGIGLARRKQNKA